MIYCPKCGVSTEQHDEDGTCLLSCPSCGVVWSEFLELMANGAKWPDLVKRGRHDIICPKCGNERLMADEAKSRTTCPVCRSSYTESILTKSSTKAQGMSETVNTLVDMDSERNEKLMASSSSSSPSATTHEDQVTVDLESLRKSKGFAVRSAIGSMGSLEKGLTFIGAVVFLGLVASGLNSYKKLHGANGEGTAREAVTSFLLDATREHMKDPDSVQFRRLDYFADHAVRQNGVRYLLRHKVCGEVNAKNSYGGYVGFRPFIAIATIDPATGKPKRDSLFLWIQDTTKSVVEQELMLKARSDDCVATVKTADGVIEK